MSGEGKHTPRQGSTSSSLNGWSGTPLEEWDRVSGVCVCVCVCVREREREREREEEVMKERGGGGEGRHLPDHL